MLKNIPITTDKDFIITLFIYILDSTKIVCTLKVSHTERKDTAESWCLKRHKIDVWSVSQQFPTLGCEIG